MIELIDLCPTLQTNVDWKKVKAAGFQGAIIKASQYSSTRIWKFKEYDNAARGAGIPTGAYHFAYVGADPVRQANFFFNACAGRGSQPGDLPPVLDLEFAQPQVPGKDIVQWGEAFLKEAVRLWYPDNRLLSPSDPRYRLPLIYSYPHFIQRLMPWLGSSGLVTYPLHIANYRSKWDPVAKQHVLIPWRPDLSRDTPLIPGGTWKIWTVWQYSGNNGIKVPGIAADCDRNVFNGTADEYNRLLGLGYSGGTSGDGGTAGGGQPNAGAVTPAVDVPVGADQLGRGVQVIADSSGGGMKPRLEPGGTASSMTFLK